MVVAIPQVLIVGLGNITLPGTRHSVGHLLVDSLASRFGIRLLPNKNLGGFSGRTNVTIGENSVSLVFLKPKAFMNISGPPVAAALRQTAKSPAAMVVIHDSLTHIPATVSSKFGGSANGHNGVRSVIAALGGSKGFQRLRVGIGRGSGDVADYVLGKLSGHERMFWGERGQGTELAWSEIEQYILKLSVQG